MIKLFLYILFEKYIYISPLEMANPEKRHCAKCIGALSFPIHPRLSDTFLWTFPFLGHFYRAMLCIRGTSHGPGSVCVCVCLSVLSQVGVLLKRLNKASHKQHHTIAQGSSFLMPTISAKFDRGHPLRGRQMQVGWVKIGDFRQITGYISKTVKNRHIVSIKVE